MTTTTNDAIEAFDRVYLEKLRLATDVLLELGEDEVINNALEAELHLLRDRIDRALLLPAAVGGLPPRHDAPSGGGSPAARS